MGCDGGTIPRRDELVRTKKKPEQKDKDAEREFRWLHCAISQQRLHEPVVMCGLGRLYLKEAVIEALLDKANLPDSVQHIKSLRDIQTLELTPNPTYVDEPKTGSVDVQRAPFICKLSGREMSGNYRFVALWNCGCAMAERSLKKVKNSSSTCPLCQTPFGIEDIIVLNGNEEDVELMQAKMEMRNRKRKLLKKDKKKIKTEEAVANTPPNNVEKIDKTPLSTPSTSKATIFTTTTSLNGNGESNKGSPAQNLKRSTPKAAEGKQSLEDPDIKRLKTNYSVSRDPNATDVYKSLFTTHKTEKDQTRAHWVTYNPFYN
ncbi:replication termination factor 2 [Teleopsis dalmanni]|uniref:replication termination factor 2 n=1 Tax=Teleopsis dalmanni TaxID=139649 RepID=UPI0018CE5B21|nr:replication termination factor 2 [Teleopsis dalmanni]